MHARIAMMGLLPVISAMLPTLTQTSHVGCFAQDTVSTSQASFRVVTDIFLGTEKKPAQQTLTLFSSGVAYDISFDDPNQITMVDPQRDRIVLLDKTTKTRALIGLKELNQFIESARKQAETSELAIYLKGAEKIDVADNVVSVGDSVLKYRSTLQQPRDEQMAVQYASAADALILLNGWRSGMPPFARLGFNRVVAEQKSLPHEITRTAGSGNHTDVVRCLLHANWRLSSDDEKLIAEIGNMLTSYQSVPAAQFFADQSKAAKVKFADKSNTQKK